MCYTVNNNSSKKVKEHTKKQLKTDNPIVASNFLSGFTHPKMYIIQQEEPNLINVAKWGLVPSFIKTEDKAKEYYVNTLNAKSETILEKISYKNSIMPRRCLIPVSGFFEWREINKTKYPYYIGLKETDIFSLGGIYDNWVNTITGEIQTTFSIITTSPNPLMKMIHNVKQRMPLILNKSQELDWLNPNLRESDIIELMQPFNQDLMKAHTIKKISLKNADVFSDEIIKEFEYPELAFYE